MIDLAAARRIASEGSPSEAVPVSRRWIAQVVTELAQCRKSIPAAAIRR